MKQHTKRVASNVVKKMTRDSIEKEAIREFIEDFEDYIGEWVPGMMSCMDTVFKEKYGEESFPKEDK